jgi:hypothetical protein
LLPADRQRHGRGATYKWTDAQGRTVYSDQPPPSANVKTEQLRAPPPPANPNAAKELAEREAEYKKKQTDAAQAATKAEKARADDAKRAEACTQAKGARSCSFRSRRS